MAIVESDKTFIFIQQAFKVNIMSTGGFDVEELKFSLNR